MKTWILMSICAAASFCTVETGVADVAGVEEQSEASVRQHDPSPGPSAENGVPQSIACAQERGEALGRCTYRIDRDKKGKTTMTVAFPNGFERRLFFEDDRFLKASMTMSGVGTNADWTLTDGTHMIRVDGQRYEVPDTLIAGNRLR